MTEERKKEVLAAEEAMLRLGKEADRMSSTNKFLEAAATNVVKAQEEVSEARKDINRYAESSASMNKRTEELVTSLNSRYEALETRLRGIDLEITAFRKGVDGLESAVLQIAKNVQGIKEDQDRAEQGLRSLYTMVIVVLALSVIGIIVSFI